MTDLLSVTGVSKRFGAVVAADAISMSAGSGSLISLIGANGAGKTTFVNIVTGYLKPDEGTIVLSGQDITALTPREITRLGVGRSFQIPQLFARLTALQNVIAAITICGDRGWMRLARSERDDVLDRARGLLDRLGLSQYESHLPNVMPGGARKLLDIAMALGTDPRLLILDEPTSGVSIDEKFSTMDTIIDTARSEGRSIIFVEHDMELVTRYSERCIAFLDGKIIADGTPAGVMGDPEVRSRVLGQAVGHADA